MMKLILDRKLNGIFNTFPCHSRRYILEESYNCLQISLMDKLCDSSDSIQRKPITTSHMEFGINETDTDDDQKIKTMNDLLKDKIHWLVDEFCYSAIDYLKRIGYVKIESIIYGVNYKKDNELISIEFKFKTDATVREVKLIQNIEDVYTKITGGKDNDISKIMPEIVYQKIIIFQLYTLIDCDVYVDSTTDESNLDIEESPIIDTIEQGYDHLPKVNVLDELQSLGVDCTFEFSDILGDLCDTIINAIGDLEGGKIKLEITNNIYKDKCNYLIVYFYPNEN